MKNGPADIELISWSQSGKTRTSALKSNTTRSKYFWKNCSINERFIQILVSSFFGCFWQRSFQNSLFIFHFVLPILPLERKTLFRKSRNLSDEKPKSKLPKYVMRRAIVCVQICLFALNFVRVISLRNTKSTVGVCRLTLVNTVAIS